MDPVEPVMVLQRMPRSCPPRSVTAVLGLPFLLAWPPPGAAAQDVIPGPPPVDTAGLSRSAFGVMEMLYEATIFNVDVFTVRLELGVREAERLREAARGRPWNGETEDALAGLVLDAREALVTVRFHRDVDLDRFLEGMGTNVRNAREAGLLSHEDEARLMADAPREFAPLAARGIRKGDTFWYRIHGDSLHVAFQARDGTPLGEVHGHGAERRIALLATYMAPGSDFRTKLLRSLPSAG